MTPICKNCDTGLNNSKGAVICGESYCGDCMQEPLQKYFYEKHNELLKAQGYKECSE